MLTVAELKEKLIIKIRSTDSEELLHKILQTIDLEPRQGDTRSDPEELKTAKSDLDKVKGWFMSHEEANKHAGKNTRNYDGL